MKATITSTKAPWPAGAAIGDVVEFDGDREPAWALGKCARAADDAEVTVGAKTAADAASLAAMQKANAEAEEERRIAAELAAAEDQAASERAAIEAKAARRAEAAGLGVTIQAKWSEDRIDQEIAKAKAAKG